ncbi:MAG: AAA family ATPase, partial [Steroidobacteraceae bacterium]
WRFRREQSSHCIQQVTDVPGNFAHAFANKVPALLARKSRVPPTVRLDQQADRTRLDETITELKPRLLVLDPFVRLHRIDENASGEVAPLLAYLRTLQRQHHLAVLVVHHARKSAGHMRAGQALRGSSEFHAWGDSNLYLRRSGDEINLTVEHRAAQSPPRIALELAQRGDALALEVVQSTAAAIPQPSSVDERITAALASANRAVPIAELRALCHIRNITLYERLTAMIDAGHLVRNADGYRLAHLA